MPDDRASGGEGMSIIEACARSGAIAILVLLAAVLLRDGRATAARRYAALFAVCAAATLVAFAPALAADRALWLLPERILAFGVAAVFWVLSAAIFDDDFTLAWPHAVAWSALVGLGFWAVYGDAGSRPFLPMNVLSLTCLLLAVRAALVGREADLVEGRRRLRLVLVGSVAFFTTAIIVSVTLLGGGRGHPVYGYANAFGALALSLFFAVTLLSLRPGALFGPVGAPPDRRSGPAAREAAASSPVPPDDPAEAAMLVALRREMEEKRAYREEALGIAVLAARFGLPEYRLRRLINQRLGYRNFSAFVSSYRLAEVMAWLADPSQADTPILTLALDAGFPSVGSFNRAFKSETGLTPSEYRRRHRQPTD
jgi:AraC-like DNA-binding protein